MSAQTEVFEDVRIIGGCIAVQFVYAAYSVFLSHLMSLGLNPLTIIIFTNSVTSLVLSPFSFHFERNLWPKIPSFKLLMQLVLVSLGGVTLFQSLYLKGIKLTSPAFATSMPNLAPGLIFLIAASFGLEKFKIGCLYNKVKILATLMCVIGAITMGIMQSNTEDAIVEDAQRVSVPSTLSTWYMLDPEKTIGCIYLFIAILTLSASAVLQGSTLGDFPAPLSLCTITTLFGAIMTTILELIEDGKVDTGTSILSTRNVTCLYLLGGIIHGACVSFSAWAMKKRGPVLVSMFNPVATVVSAILSYIILGQQITPGSLAGMLLVFSGLYLFLWAKAKEDFHIVNEDVVKSEQLDVEKPFLS